jgi:hypothetical protein
MRSAYPELATEIDLMQRRELPPGWDAGLPIFPADPKGIAGRDASGRVLNVLAQNVPWLLGGSADLGPSTKTTLTFEGAGKFEPGTPGGRNLHFGVREADDAAGPAHVTFPATSSTATRAVTSGGSTLSWYSCVWCSKISQDGIETTRERMPSASSSSCA